MERHFVSEPVDAGWQGHRSPAQRLIASRTIVAVSQDGQTGYFLLVDGNELAGAGILIDEATVLLAPEGPMNLMINMDGGGSWTGCAEGCGWEGSSVQRAEQWQCGRRQKHAVATHIGLRLEWNSIQNIGAVRPGKRDKATMRIVALCCRHGGDSSPGFSSKDI